MSIFTINANHLITNGFQFEGLVSQLTAAQNAFARGVEQIADVFNGSHKAQTQVQNQNIAAVAPTGVQKGVPQTETKSILS